MMKIHAIQSGTVAITTAWCEGVGHGRRRLLHAILDRPATSRAGTRSSVTRFASGSSPSRRSGRSSSSSASE
jgi:hypothetical protein